MSVDHHARDAGDMRAYRTEIPNIVFVKLAEGEITSDDFVLYCVLKRTAGDDGNSTKATKTLAGEAHASPGGIVASKRRLINAGLIEVETIERKSGDLRLGGRMQHRITVVDVWPENMAMFAKRQTVEASSPSEQASSPDEQASSRGGTKEENIPPIAKAIGVGVPRRKPARPKPAPKVDEHYGARWAAIYAAAELPANRKHAAPQHINAVTTAAKAFAPMTDEEFAPLVAKAAAAIRREFSWRSPQLPPTPAQLQTEIGRALATAKGRRSPNVVELQPVRREVAS